MSTRLTTENLRSVKVAMYDSVSGIAFGPVFDSEDEAEAFLTFAENRLGDVRRLGPGELDEIHLVWVNSIAGVEG